MVAKLQTLRVEAAGEAAEGGPGEGDAAAEGSGFGALVTGAWRERPRVEVPRAFAALLQLVNDGNVAVERGAGAHALWNMARTLNSDGDQLESS